MLGPRSPYQCARKHRQTCDYVFAVWRICELSREWGVPLTCVKIDVQKAFDSVLRPRLISKLRARLGDTHEMACCEQLLCDTRALLVTPWGASGFLMETGIKQGAVESPCFFGLLMEEALEETARLHSWGQGPRMFSDFEFEGLLFMDDGFLWHSDRRVVQTRLEQLAAVLLTYGLVLNLRKCQLYCSRDTPLPHQITLAGVSLRASSYIEVMGLRVSKGLSPCELIQPLLARAKQKFWSLKHLLRCKTPVKGRIRLLQRVVAGSAMWCIAAIPPDRAAMGMLNSVQAMLLGWVLRLFKGEGETWLQFRMRVVRSARAALHSSGGLRWSTIWLQRWWDYSGHRVRSVLSDFPPLRGLLDEFRSLSWWRRVQVTQQGPKHKRHFARLTLLEEAMNRTCGGPWRSYAHDRVAWAGLRAAWVRQNDLPWASGRQLALPTWTEGTLKGRV